MLRKLTPREQLALFVETWQPTLRTAFLDAIDDIRSGMVIKLIVERLERGDIVGALDAMNIDRQAFERFEQAFEQAYTAGGNLGADGLALTEPEGYRAVFRFGVRNTPAEAWLRNYSGNLITAIVEEQREIIRAALVEGLSQGQNPRQTALEIAGRVNQATGEREGGILGLSRPYAAAVAKTRSALLSGDLAGMRAYLELRTRDKRFDRTVAKAIREGKPMPKDMADKIVARLESGYLKLRADTVSLHETFRALSASRNEAIRQAIAAGKIDAQDVTKVWKRTTSEHPRMQHIAMVGQTVPFGQPFIAPDGTPIMHPHAEGIPASHSLGCKCQVEYVVDYTAQLIRRRAQ